MPRAARSSKSRQTHRLLCKMYDDERRFYAAVTDYIRTGYQAMERHGDPAQRRAAGFLLTTFQKLNGSSTAAIRAALTSRLLRLRGVLDGLPPEAEEPEEIDERYEGEVEERAALRGDREMVEGEIAVLEKLLAQKVKRDRKLDELVGLIDHVAQESGRGAEEKVLIFTEYRETQRHLVCELEGRYGKGSVAVIHGGMATVEETVQAYFEDRLGRAAAALAKVTGENPEEIKGTLNGQLESEIDPERIYERALVEGNLNKQTQKEIAEAVERAKRAYEIATRSLFRDVSRYSFDSYRRELATDLTLDDLRAFTERFLARHRRQLLRKDAFLEFLTPDVLRTPELPERVRNATFDRELAIKRPDAEFLALGHPVVDAMLRHAGAYDFGGLTAVRVIAEPKLAGRSGFLFVFVARERITREDADECLFRLEPVFVTADGRVDEDAVWPAVAGTGEAASPVESVPDPGPAFATARERLAETAAVWDWADDVEFLGLSWVEFR